MPNKQKKLPLPKGNSLVIVGLMGAGKSCIGRNLAAHYGVPFVDADREIEEAAGCCVADIFEIYGEAAFRDGERRVIKRILEGEPCILATGGGAFMNDETRKLIEETGTCLWLKADVEVLIKRTTGRKHRPLLNQGNPAKVLRKLVDERYPVYAMADITVETKDEALDATVSRVITTLKKLSK
ncbi:Shikimate kinase [Candidatus Terasakiella magnetica]|uniref:Shikimate kinase n=1 Tax=Candidatus Terasakiella magnetica TaxID=1867952 RepID=A0A1C3RKT1_9PROT|nr:shikimate kinase [Candidatus Terasakiella magnetica]SCA57932.1 Shikimate kinase [Candidatus Terasakiella magnetica]